MARKGLNKKQLDGFKKQLVKMKEDILHDIKNMDSVNSADAKDRSGDVSGHALHMADVATDMYDREFNLGLASNEREILQRIDNALKRIDTGTYGVCQKTNKPISLQRLKAIPYAELSKEAQEELENSENHK